MLKIRFLKVKQNAPVKNEEKSVQIEESDSDSEDELDILPEGSIDVKKYDNFKLVRYTYI